LPPPRRQQPRHPARGRRGALPRQGRRPRRRRRRGVTRTTVSHIPGKMRKRRVPGGIHARRYIVEKVEPVHRGLCTGSGGGGSGAVDYGAAPLSILTILGRASTPRVMFGCFPITFAPTP